MTTYKLKSKMGDIVNVTLHDDATMVFESSDGKIGEVLDVFATPTVCDLTVEAAFKTDANKIYIDSAYCDDLCKLRDAHVAAKRALVGGCNELQAAWDANQKANGEYDYWSHRDDRDGIWGHKIVEAGQQLDITAKAYDVLAAKYPAAVSHITKI